MSAGPEGGGGTLGDTGRWPWVAAIGPGGRSPEPLLPVSFPHQLLGASTPSAWTEAASALAPGGAKCVCGPRLALHPVLPLVEAPLPTELQGHTPLKDTVVLLHENHNEFQYSEAAVISPAGTALHTELFLIS